MSSKHQLKWGALFRVTTTANQRHLHLELDQRESVDGKNLNEEALKLIEEASKTHHPLAINAIFEGDTVLIQSLELSHSLNSGASVSERVIDGMAALSAKRLDPLSTDAVNRRAELRKKIKDGMTEESKAGLFALLEYCENELAPLK